ncbi:MAG: TonB family protein, partial [Acidobacteriota bacterium]|nr:TonB family protein [Acidobacteriota bacterium]
RDQTLLGLPTLDGTVTIHFVFHRDGHVSEVEILAPSPVPTLDRASATALIRAVLPPLPADFPRDQEGITYSFTIQGFESSQQLQRRLRWSRAKGEF